MTPLIPGLKHAPKKSSLSRRDALLAGLTMLSGGALTAGLIAGGKPVPMPPQKNGHPETNPARDYLHLADDDLLCQAETAISLAETTPWEPSVRRVVLRLLYACMDNVSIQNEIIAVRSLYILMANNWLNADAVDLVAATANCPIAQATLLRFHTAGLLPGHGKED